MVMRSEDHILVYGTSHPGAEARQSAARFARILYKLAQRICEDLTAVHVADSDTRREVTCYHARLHYLDGESRSFNSFIKEGLEGPNFHLYEVWKICPQWSTYWI